ncbi:MAG: hypothetical protein LBU32_10795 [Clostridiales bacterium]|nr:hypothetical protein [Clostridiales bacterium]
MAYRRSVYVFQNLTVDALDLDFMDEKLGKSVSYGIYDVARNECFINIGVDHDTSTSWLRACVNGTMKWLCGLPQHDKAYDHGGWRRQQRLQKPHAESMACESGRNFNLEIHVSHFPPDISKRNNIAIW